jgi:hypothetical protein
MGKISVPARVWRHFLWRTGLRNAIDRALWKVINEGPEFEFVYRRSFEAFKDLPTVFEDGRYSSFIAKDSEKWSHQEEHILCLYDALIEPNNCIAILGKRNIVEQSRILESLYPRFRILRGNETKLDAAVLYDGYASLNYYHHIADAVNRLHAAVHKPEVLSLPLIVSQKAFRSPFFGHLLQRSRTFASLRWRVQKPNEWIRVKRLFRLQSAPFDGTAWEKTRALYCPRDVLPTKRVFLSRDRTRVGRVLDNEGEIEIALNSAGFEKVYAEHLSLDEQLDLFNETAYLVAIHGAGLVQQLFMPAESAHVIEMMPGDYLMPLYYWEAFARKQAYYDVVVGSELRSGAGFHVSRETLMRAVSRMLSSKPGTRVYGCTRINNPAAVPVLNSGSICGSRSKS